jgi:hypothetical protein
LVQLEEAVKAGDITGERMVDVMAVDVMAVEMVGEATVEEVTEEGMMVVEVMGVE